MKLGIVGHGAEKFTPETRERALHAIGAALDQFQPTHVVSGHSPLGGVDIWAEEAAMLRKIPTIIHAPQRFAWSGPGGYKERNLAIAKDSDLCLVIVVRELPSGYAGGVAFDACYHCRDRNPPHVKSGGCWTAWRAQRREWVIL